MWNIKCEVSGMKVFIKNMTDRVIAVSINKYIHPQRGIDHDLYIHLDWKRKGCYTTLHGRE